jgi:hypothetical protein
MTLTLHRTRDMAACYILFPQVDPSTKPSHTLCTQHYYSTHKALTVTQTSDHINPTYALIHQLDRASFLHGLDLYLYIEKGLNNGRHPFPVTIFPKKPKKVPQKVVKSRDLRFAMHSVFDRQSKYQTVNYDQVFLKTWSRANK